MSFFSQNHTEINSDDWTITKKTTRTIKHEIFSKMKKLKVDRWALSLSVFSWFLYGAPHNIICNICNHDDVIKWKQFPRYWPFVWGLHRSPVKSPHKGQWRGVLMFSLICARINGWVNNCEAGDLGRPPTHCDVIVMFCTILALYLRKIYGIKSVHCLIYQIPVIFPVICQFLLFCLV